MQWYQADIQERHLLRKVLRKTDVILGRSYGHSAVLFRHGEDLEELGSAVVMMVLKGDGLYHHRSKGRKKRKEPTRFGNPRKGYQFPPLQLRKGPRFSLPNPGLWSEPNGKWRTGMVGGQNLGCASLVLGLTNGDDAKGKT